MKVLIAGSSGFIGSELTSCLKGRGHQVFRLVRSEQREEEDTIVWDPQHREIKPNEFEGFDLVVNLAGENIASGRWTEEKKKKIRDSRVIGTHMLAELLARLKTPPKLLINASAVGYYGDRGEEWMDEQALPGTGFLADVCVGWEAAADAAKQAGIRVVKLRFGVVLDPQGGALGKMLIPFRLGLGGVIGSGKQYMSWISIDDVIGIVLHVINHPEIQGPINAVAPEPVTNRVFTKTLGKVLRRPTILPVPAWVVTLLFGEMAQEMLLSSTRVLPGVLQKTGYQFLYPELNKALAHLLES